MAKKNNALTLSAMTEEAKKALNPAIREALAKRKTATWNGFTAWLEKTSAKKETLLAEGWQFSKKRNAWYLNEATLENLAKRNAKKAEKAAKKAEAPKAESKKTAKKSPKAETPKAETPKEICAIVGSTDKQGKEFVQLFRADCTPEQFTSWFKAREKKMRIRFIEVLDKELSDKSLKTKATKLYGKDHHNGLVYRFDYAKGTAVAA